MARVPRKNSVSSLTSNLIAHNYLDIFVGVLSQDMPQPKETKQVNVDFTQDRNMVFLALAKNLQEFARILSPYSVTSDICAVARNLLKLAEPHVKAIEAETLTRRP